MSQSATIVRCLWNYCNVLRDDGISYDDYLETHYRHILTELGKGSDLIPVIFRKVQNRIQDPTKLKRPSMVHSQPSQELNRLNPFIHLSAISAPQRIQRFKSP